VLLATLNRPSKGNALSQLVISELDALVRDIDLSFGKEDCPRVLVITGAGPKTFCAGADVTELDGIGSAGARKQMRFGQAVFERLERLPVPVLAAINGFALGGGLELAMACDIRIASHTATLGQPEILLANIPGWGGTQRLPLLIGRAIANELIFTGSTISAARAYEIGLVNQVVDDAKAVALDLAAVLATRSPTALMGAKRAIDVGMQAGRIAGLLVEADAVGACCDTDDQRAAVKAFLDRKNGKGPAA